MDKSVGNAWMDLRAVAEAAVIGPKIPSAAMWDQVELIMASAHRFAVLHAESAKESTGHDAKSVV